VPSDKQDERPSDNQDENGAGRLRWQTGGGEISKLWCETKALARLRMLYCRAMYGDMLAMFGDKQKRDSASFSIRDLLDREGSDKGKLYGGLYDVLLQPHLQTIRCMVEIGIGTLIPEAVSSMARYAAKHYRPGGSLRAWRNFLPQAEVYGLDVAPDTQFADEPRIHTYLCDSTDADQTARFLSQITRQPDFIVDDGSHDVISQVKTLKNFLPALRDGGLYVVEDVWDIPTVPTLIGELNIIQPGCHYFVDRTSAIIDRTLAIAIVIRKPLHDIEHCGHSAG
jgi:hypothetical protein